MRTITVVFAILSVLVFLPSCGGKKPVPVEEQPTETVQGTGLTVEGTDTGIEEEDIETALAAVRRVMGEG